MEYKTTRGEIQWNDIATDIQWAEDPVEPQGLGWELVGSTMTEVRSSTSHILWFWRRKSPTE